MLREHVCLFFFLSVLLNKAFVLAESFLLVIYRFLLPELVETEGVEALQKNCSCQWELQPGSFLENNILQT